MMMDARHMCTHFPASAAAYISCLCEGHSRVARGWMAAWMSLSMDLEDTSGPFLLK